MDRDQALAGIKSSSPHERFTAVRALGQIANEDDLPVLLRARQVETDAFVKGRLELAIAACSRSRASTTGPAGDIEENSDLSTHVRSQAIEWVAGLLLHEIGSKLGLIARSVAREIPNFDDSKTNKYVKDLQSIFDGIKELKSASARSTFTEFELAELVDEVVGIESDGRGVEVLRVGARPSVISGDPHLLRLALSNGVRNAIEASSSSAELNVAVRPNGNEHLPPTVIVTWGNTDVDYWITVIDSGPGLSTFTASAFDIGKSTKRGHHGFGLAIAKQAMETLNGSVALHPSPGGGATYELRWEKIK